MDVTGRGYVESFNITRVERVLGVHRRETFPTGSPRPGTPVPWLT